MGDFLKKYAVTITIPESSALREGYADDLNKELLPEIKKLFSQEGESWEQTRRGFTSDIVLTFTGQSLSDKPEFEKTVRRITDNPKYDMASLEISTPPKGKTL